MPAKFIVYRTRGGQFYFTLESSREEILLTSDTFIFRVSCLRTIETLRSAVEHEYNYQRGTGTNGEHFFVVRGPDQAMLARSEFYAGLESMNNAREWVKKEAGGAELKDEA